MTRILNNAHWPTLLLIGMGRIATSAMPPAGEQIYEPAGVRQGDSASLNVEAHKSDDVAPLQSLVPEAIAAANAVDEVPLRALCLREIADPLVLAARKADAEKVLAEALKAIDALHPRENDQLNDQFGMLAYVSAMQARLGELDAARETATRIHPERMAGFGPNPKWWTAIVAKELAAGQARAGQFAEATRTIEPIESSYWRGEALGAMALVQAKSGDPKAAEKTAEQIESTLARSKVLIVLAKLEMRAGHKQEASRLLSAAAQPAEQGDAQEQAIAILLAATAEAELGNREEALRLTQQIPPFAELGQQFATRVFVCCRESATAEVLARMGDVSGAVHALASPPADKRANMLRGVADALAKAGNANDLAKLIEDFPADQRATLQLPLTKALANSGDFDGALRTAAQTDNVPSKLEALTYIADRQATAGKTEAAESLLRQVLRDAQSLPAGENARMLYPPGSSRALLAEVAEVQGRLGKWDDALAWIRKEPSPIVRSLAMSRLIAGMLQVKGHFNVELDTNAI